MRIGFLTDARLEQLDWAQQNGFGSIQWNRFETSFAGPANRDWQGEAGQFAGEAKARNLRISAIGAHYRNPLDPDPQVSKRSVDHLKRVILGAEKLGLKNVNTFVGRDWTRSVDQNWPRFLKIWKPLIAFAEDHDIKIGIENCPMLFGPDEWPGGKNLATTPVIWRRMFNDIPSDHFGLNYDPSHFVLQHMDPASPLREFQDKFFHLHAKDVKIRRERMNEVGVFAHPLEWHQPRIPGYGEMDWGKFMSALMETKYRGPVCIEVEDDTFGKSLEGRKQAIKVARNVLEPYF